MSNHCYLRGWSILGLFNTIMGCLFRRVLVRVRDLDTGQVIDWYWDRAKCYPPEGQ